MAKRKKRKSVASKAATMKIGGKTYKQHSCKGGKANAKKVRATGNYASVRYVSGCTWVRKTR